MGEHNQLPRQTILCSCTYVRDANVCVHKLIETEDVPSAKYCSANFDDAVIIDPESSGLHVVENPQIHGTAKINDKARTRLQLRKPAYASRNYYIYACSLPFDAMVLARCSLWA